MTARTIIATLALILATATPAAAHNWYDGSPWGEGSFSAIIGTNNDGSSGRSLTAGADDTQTDTHCVFAKVVRRGYTSTAAYSCGARDTAHYSDTGTYNISVCVTGVHYECDWQWSRTV